MVADFVGLMEGDPEADILLRRGDLISVATRRDFVSVLGLVYDPGNIPFEGGVGVEEYIQRAGGYAEKADKGKTRVIRAGSGEWVPSGEAKVLGPGDTIWIPEKTDRDYWRIFQDTLTVTAQVLTIYLIVDRATQ
jgi:polysaccharide export outer membrane protein